MLARGLLLLLLVVAVSSEGVEAVVLVVEGGEGEALGRPAKSFFKGLLAKG